MRKAVAVALSVAIQTAGLSAPLVHAHTDSHATQHHSGRAVHTHWGGHAQSRHSSGAPAVEAPEHDRQAVFLNAFVAVAAPARPDLVVTVGVSDLPVPAERAAHRTVEMTHAHDPPTFRSLPSRAPPAFLS